MCFTDDGYKVVLAVRVKQNVLLNEHLVILIFVFKELDVWEVGGVEREVVVRGSWKIDCLVRRRDQLLLGQMMLEEDGNREGECGYGWLNTVHESPAIRSATVKDKHDDETGKKIGVSSMHTVFVTSAKSSSKLSKKSLLNKISTTLRNIFTTSPITPTRLTLLKLSSQLSRLGTNIVFT